MLRTTVAASLVLGLGGALAAQDPVPPAPPEPPKPSVHHGHLRALVGTWDAEAEIPGPPRMPPTKFNCGKS